MRTTIDKAGRVVVPKKIRDSLKLQGGETLEIRESDGRIEIAPVPARVRLEDGPDGWVAVPEEDLPDLTDELVRETVERSRR